MDGAKESETDSHEFFVWLLLLFLFVDAHTHTHINQRICKLSSVQLRNCCHCCVSPLVIVVFNTQLTCDTRM